MGLTKQYLRYQTSATFNLIASKGCNVSFVPLEGQEGRFVACGGCEHVFIWDMRLGQKAQVLSGEEATVSCLCVSPNKRHLAVGYSDGNVQVYDLKTAEVVSIFSGHRSEVTALAFDAFGHKLASGSKDTDIVIWDTVAESGICRFSGHRGPITDLVFMTEYPVLISSSKDMFIKFWDLELQHCFKTLVGQRAEVWSLSLMRDKYLVAGCTGNEMPVYKIFKKEESDKPTVDQLQTALETVTLSETDDDPTHPIQCTKIGSVLRAGKGRVVSMCSDESNQILACHGIDPQIELFHFCSEEEAKQRMKKRLRKERSQQLKSETQTPEDHSLPIDSSLTLRDEVIRLKLVKLSAKPKSVHVALGNGGELRIVAMTADNALHLFSTSIEDKKLEPVLYRSIYGQGHRGEVRAVCFSSDNLALVSGSAESVKIWNRPTQSCVRTVETGYVLSIMFVPGDRHVLAGLKDGRLLIIDIAAGDILEEIAAHSKELWSICLETDLRGCVTGGGDKTVKFWQFELIVDEKSESKAKVLSLLHTRTLKLDDSVLCVRLSPNGKFLAAALLDSTVKIFFADSFKFYLSLYGHSLPVLCMDISSDSTLIATGSADRNVKIWGMDFGDCHRSIFAHDDSVMGLQFVPKTHYFFTCGKDGKVKEWDADSFNKIVTLKGHSGEAWALAVSPNGLHVVTSGSDKVLRMFERSDQIVVLEDEEEEERAKQEELATGEERTVPGQSSIVLASKKTVGSEKSADSILECLEICEKFNEQLAEHKALQTASTQNLPLPQPHPLMQAYNITTADDFFVETIKRIRSSDLEEALLLLPFSTVCQIIQMLPQIFTRGDQTELLCKVFIFLLKIHHGPLTSNQSLLPTLMQLQKITMKKVAELRDLVGYNLYAMHYMKRQIEDSEGVQLFRDATLERKKSVKRKRQREKLKRAITVLS